MVGLSCSGSRAWLKVATSSCCNLTSEITTFFGASLKWFEVVTASENDFLRIAVSSTFLRFDRPPVMLHATSFVVHAHFLTPRTLRDSAEYLKFRTQKGNINEWPLVSKLTLRSFTFVFTPQVRLRLISPPLYTNEQVHLIHDRS